jgi:hypothetical protein
MSRKLIIVLCAAMSGGCGGGGTTAAPVLSGEELREGCVASTLDVLLGTVDLLARAADAEDLEEIRAQLAACAVATDSPDGELLVACADPMVLARVELDGGALRVTIEAEGFYRTEASLVLVRDPDLGVAVAGSLRTDAPEGCVVEGVLDRVFARAVADLPGSEFGAVFTAGDVDLDVRAGGTVIARGTAALRGRRALVALDVGGTPTEGEIDLAAPRRP